MNTSFRLNVRTAVTAALAMTLGLATSSCTPVEDNPLKQALSDKIKERNVQLETLQISGLTVTDSVSLGAELDRRMALFRTKVKAEKKMVDKCLAGKAPSKAQEHNKKVVQAEEILETLTQWRNSADKDMDSTLYYIAAFNASGKCYDGAELKPTAMQATFTADGTVFNVNDAGNNIHTGMGFTIPGYKALLESFSIPEEGE